MIDVFLERAVKYLLRKIFDVHVVKDCALSERNYIIASNHLNWIDPILVNLFWPQAISLMFIGPRPVVTNTTWKRWFVEIHPQIVLTPQRSGWLGKDAYQAVLEGLKKGESLLIFPEGDAYPEEGDLKPLFNGVAHFALKTGVPIIPIGLCGTAELYYRKQLIMHIGRPIPVPLVSRPDKVQIDNALGQIRENILHLINGYRDPDVTNKRLRWLTHLL